MRLFKDSENREWEIKLTIGSAKKLNERLKPFNLDFMDTNAMLLRLADVFFTADLLYLVCQDQAEKRGIDSWSFGEAIGGLILYNARSAFIEEYIDFFPDPTVQQSLKEVLKRSEEMAELGKKAVLATIDREKAKLTSAINGE